MLPRYPCYFVFLVALVFACGSVSAQQHPPNSPDRAMPFAIRFAATEANSPPGTCGCFFLIGGAADVGLPLFQNLSVDVELAGNHESLVPGTSRGLSTITLLAGPRYRVPIPRHQSAFVQTLFGAARGFDAQFRTGSDSVDTATAFGYALGGGYELSLTRTLSLRAAQVEYVQTNLPNGSDNRQRNFRLGAGVVLHLTATGLRR